MSGSQSGSETAPPPAAAVAGEPAESVLRRLHDAQASLSPRLAAAATYLIASPDEIAFTSMRRMAERAGVQPAIMVRLAQRLGFDGYEALRAPFRAALQRHPGGLGQRARDLQARVSHRSGGYPLARLAHERIALDRENLDATLAAIGGERLAEIASRLAAAERLFVAGQAGLHAVAFSFCEAVSAFRQNVVLLGGGGHPFGAELRSAGAADALLVFSFAPYGAALLRALRFARQRGVAVIAVTDGEAPAVARVGVETVPVVTDEKGVMPSIVAPVALAQVLADQMLALGGQAALDTIAETEAQHEALTVA